MSSDIKDDGGVSLLDAARGPAIFGSLRNRFFAALKSDKVSV